MRNNVFTQAKRSVLLRCQLFSNRSPKYKCAFEVFTYSGAVFDSVLIASFQIGVVASFCLRVVKTLL